MKLFNKLTAKFGDAVLESGEFRGDEYLIISPAYLLKACLFLRDDKDFLFDMLVDLCGVDHPDNKERFEVVYHLYSVELKKRLRLKVNVGEKEPVLPSVTSVWKAANWFEREAFDLFGIRFDGHPNLKRLLTYEGFEGHALRKDYPKQRRQGIPVPDTLIDKK